MPLAPPDRTECPPAEDLDRLIHGRLGEARSSALTDHVGRCCGCQERLEHLAAGDDPALTTIVRQCSADRTPAASALWPALSAAEAEISSDALLPVSHPAPRPSGILTLGFLSPTDTPGRLGKLGTFDVIREVGRGGMGVVLHAYDPCLSRDVAIKVLDPLLAGNEVARQRFCREARAAAAVTHENLVTVHQVNEDETSGLPYLVMQLITGESLEQRLKRVGKMPPADVARLGQQAAAGLAAAHATGLIHRDIKPGNILLEAGTDKVKLTDFGLARAAEDVKLTRSGFVAGTPLYMAPEQARGDEVDARADLFSLGSVLYEAAAGAPPFDGKTPLAVLRRVADETQPPLRVADPSVPVWLSDVTDRLLAKDPADRFQTAGEVADIFATELARAQAHAATEVAVGPCGQPIPSIYALRRAPVCWVTVLRRVAPWAGGALAGALLVGLWPSAAKPTPPPADAPHAAAAEPTPARALLLGPPGPVWAVGFTPDALTVAVGAEDGSVRLMDPRDGSVRRTLGRMGGNVWSVDTSADGKHLAVTCDDATVKVYDLGMYTVAYSFPHPTSTKAAVFTPDGKALATGDRNATVRLWDLATQVPAELRGHKGTVNALAVSPDGRQLASGASDGAVKVWDLTDLKRDPVSLEEHTGSVYGVAFSPDGSRLASAGWDGTVRVRDARNGEQLHVLKGHDGDVWSVAFGQGGKVLASAGSDGTVRVWDVESGRELHSYRGTGRGFHAVRFAKDGTTLAAGGRDGTVRVWDVPK